MIKSCFPPILPTPTNNLSLHHRKRQRNLCRYNDRLLNLICLNSKFDMIWHLNVTLFGVLFESRFGHDHSIRNWIIEYMAVYRRFNRSFNRHQDVSRWYARFMGLKIYDVTFGCNMLSALFCANLIWFTCLTDH